MDELTKEFLVESMEGLDRMERCLTELELRPRDAELLGEIFRSVHTIKGTTGFLGFSRLEKLAHAGENLLGALREGTLQVNGELISGLLRLLDGLRVILRLIETTGAEGVRAGDEDSALIDELRLLNEGHGGAAKVSAMEDLGAAGTGMAASQADRTLRIDVEVLNRMMNLVGELVLTRNQILQSQPDAQGFATLTRRLDSVTVDLRETVMQARLQPVGHLFGKFPRMVRDLARACGKQVRIEFCGQETALDKSLLEAIKDPLTHAVRNAVDHGVEAPEQRALAGKPLEGVVRLKAWHQSGSVVIEVSDDGAGISCRRVIAKALERHLITEERAAGMSDAEALQLVFLAGFSTAATVTTISGRGVGMDVVRANVEKAGGSVELQSTEGMGTVLRLRVPLTLAIVPALVVQSGGQSFCLPQNALAELVYVPAEEACRDLERMGEAELYRLRERLLPLVWLDRMLGLEPVQSGGGFYLAVLEADGCRFGLAVDELVAPEEIVVKPLSAVLREAGLFSGATVLGSGLLAMILDVSATAARAGVKPVLEQLAGREAAVPSRAVDGSAPAFLIYRQSGGDGSGTSERMAIPLMAVERIESVAVREVEFAGGQAMLQYRGVLMLLEDDCGLLRELRATGPEAVATVLICRRASAAAEAGETRLVGMVVREVLDVANGTWLAEDAELAPVKLAMVKERLTTVHEAFSEAGAWREVA